MAGNELGNTVLLDVTNLEVTGDSSPEAGTATEVSVSFVFAQPLYSVVWQPANWPFTIKVYAEGIGARPELITTQPGTCNQANPDYVVPVPLTLGAEGVYLITALVELDNGAGFIMGWSEEERRISAWTAI
jgi:hypothetical protein